MRVYGNGDSRYSRQHPALGRIHEGAAQLGAMANASLAAGNSILPAVGIRYCSRFGDEVVCLDNRCENTYRTGGTDVADNVTQIRIAALNNGRNPGVVILGLGNPSVSKNFSNACIIPGLYENISLNYFLQSNEKATGNFLYLASTKMIAILTLHDGKLVASKQPGNPKTLVTNMSDDKLGNPTDTPSDTAWPVVQNAAYVVTICETGDISRIIPISS